MATRSEILADWITELSLSDMPDNVISATRHTVIDTVALGVAALGTDYGLAARKAFQESGQSTVWGSPDLRSPYAAAVINGTCSHGEDYDNTFEGCPMHSGVVIVPALFAAGEAFELNNADVAKGLVVGIEVANRLALVSGRGIHTAGFHPTAILGTMGAAAGVASAFGQSKSQIRNTLGIAGSMASGIIEYLADGSSTKRLHPGWSAQSGIRAAQLGAAGFNGPATVFEGVHGLYAGFSPSIEPDFTPLITTLGIEWQSANVAFKPYACGTMTQPFIDCAIRLRTSGLTVDQIVQITCEVGEGTVHRLWEPLAFKQAPPNPYAAKFSTPYTIAAGLIYGAAGLAEFTERAVANPEVLQLAGKISYKIDHQNEYPVNYTGHIRAMLKDGTVAEERQGQLRGGAKDPLSEAEIIQKAAENLKFAGRKVNAIDQLILVATRLFCEDGKFNTAELRSL